MSREAFRETIKLYQEARLLETSGKPQMLKRSHRENNLYVEVET